jgi:hypothetical protein
MAAGSAPKTVLTEKSAATLVRKIRKSGWKPALVNSFVLEHAPVQHQSDYLALWTHFAEEAQETLVSDHDHKLHDALALLRRECHVGQ